MKKAVSSILLLLLFISTYAQNKEKAHDLMVRAVGLEDSGQHAKAIGLLEEAERLDAEDYVYPYEIAYSYYQMKAYENALAAFKRTIKHNNAPDLVFEMGGNIYDDMGDSKKAMEVYHDGLKRYPNSGRLNMEIGTIYYLHKHYDTALAWYEKGISKDPKFPSNYYRAARIFLLMTDEQVWGMIYGELFMNLERSGERNSEMGKLLYDTYRSQITKNDTSMHISFTKLGNYVNADDVKKGKPLPFSTSVYETLLGTAAAIIGKFDLDNLCAMRKVFIENYFKQNLNKTYPIVLFDYQNKIYKAEYFDAYSHWILADGDMEGFRKWKEKNKLEWEQFVDWYKENPLVMNDANKFLSYDYH